MNLFLLLSAPLFLIIFSRFMMPKAEFPILWKGLFCGALTSAIIFAIYWIFRDGWIASWDILGLFTHHLLGEFLIFIVPMVTAFILWGPKGQTDSEFLSSAFGWFGGLFVLLGLRDFYVTMAGFDDYQLFMLPAIRILLMVVLPLLTLGFFHTGSLGGRIIKGFGILGVSALGAGLITARLLGFGLMSWALLLGLGAVLYFWSRRRYS